MHNAATFCVFSHKLINNYNNYRNFRGNDQSNNRNNNDQRSPHKPRFQRQNNFRKQEKEKKEAGVTIRYHKGKIGENKIKHSLTVKGEDHVTKVTTENASEVATKNCFW